VIRHRIVSTLALAVMIAVSWAAPALAAGRFVDDDGNVHEGFIEAIAADGITSGCNPPVNDRYCPDDPVTRGQMAAFLTRALNYTSIDPNIEFVDDNNSPFETDIAKLATAGVTRGCNPPLNDRYCPDDPVTRGQMASFLGRALGLEPRAPTGFRCTEVVGFSQTNQWYTGGATRAYSPFEELVDDGAYQLRWVEGAEARIIAREDWPGWDQQPESPCVSPSPDRAILTITGARGTDVEAWESDIRLVLDRARIELPTVSWFVLQPVVGGPEGAECFADGVRVRADLQHPYIWEAILQVAGEFTDVQVGMAPRVDFCSDFKDARGHLADEAIPRIGEKIGDYYS